MGMGRGKREAASGGGHTFSFAYRPTRDYKQTDVTGRSKRILASSLICPGVVRSHRCNLSFSSAFQVNKTRNVRLTGAHCHLSSYSPIQASLNTFVANCRNLMGVRDGSDKLVSTPAAPNIRIIPSIVPIKHYDVYQARRHRWYSHSPTASILDTGSNVRVVTFRT